jgi:hypothetical protein
MYTDVSEECIHVQGRRISQVRNRQEARDEQSKIRGLIQARKERERAVGSVAIVHKGFKGEKQ